MRRLKDISSRNVLLALVGVLLIAQTSCLASAHTSGTNETERTRYGPVVSRPHDTMETVQYVGYIYLLTLGSYLYISRDEVFHNASFSRYVSNFGNIAIFDQDLPTANWGVHLLTGAVAFEFYRARSYSLTDSFFLTLAQECLFQFTIETLIQPTGLENVVNTTVLGSVLGRGLEVASLPMMNSDFFLFRWLGYVLNVPALLGFYETKTRVVPLIERDSAGLELQIGF